MARKVDEAANFVFVQLIEQEPGIYVHDKHYPDCARQNKRGLAWERISCETKESGSWLSSLETIKAFEFKLSRKNGCTQCFIFSCPLFSRPFNHHHVMTGSVLLSDIAEEKWTKLKIEITH
jgi:hypothetical protein